MTSPRARERILDASAEYVLDHGLIGFSLRPLAAAVGTSDRMLLYHFGCKENLVDALISRANETVTTNINAYANSTSSDLSLDDIINATWTFLCSNNGKRLSRLYIELCALSLREPARWAPAHRAMRQSWGQLLDSALHSDASSTTERGARQRLVIAAVDGLLIDGLMTGEKAEVEAALEQLLLLIKLSAPAPSTDEDPRS